MVRFKMFSGLWLRVRLFVGVSGTDSGIGMIGDDLLDDPAGRRVDLLPRLVGVALVNPAR